MSISPAAILGSHFRPPAKLIFQYLASGTVLLLEPEPDNPYDANAIKVMLPSSDLPSDPEFIDNLSSFGHDIEELHSRGTIHLAYIERGRTGDFQGVTQILLSFGPKGQPMATPAEPKA